MSRATDFDTSMGVEVLTLRALEVQNAIGYGTVDINQNTGTTIHQFRYRTMVMRLLMSRLLVRI